METPVVTRVELLLKFWEKNWPSFNPWAIVFTRTCQGEVKMSEDIFLDHVAIAVSNLEQAVKVYEDLGLKFSPEREKVEDQKVTTAFAPIDTRAHLELLEPIGSDGPVAKFIAAKGEGIHHLCYRVSDVFKTSKELQGKGYRMIYSEPVSGANDCMVNFIHPKSTGGVLIEISQKKAKDA